MYCNATYQLRLLTISGNLLVGHLNAMGKALKIGSSRVIPVVGTALIVVVILKAVK